MKSPIGSANLDSNKQTDIHVVHFMKGWRIFNVERRVFLEIFSPTLRKEYL